MNCKSLFFLVVFSLTLISGVFAQKKVSILGDSYSTFYGHVSPAANLCWYGVPGEKKENDVTKVEETWWYRFIHEHGFQLERNNSYSGSTVCHTGYEKADYSDRSFITRIHNLGTPDIILVFGGTNDSWAGAPIGAYQYDGWTKADLYSFRPAFCYLHSDIKLIHRISICSRCRNVIRYVPQFRLYCGCCHDRIIIRGFSFVKFLSCRHALERSGKPAGAGA